MCFSTEASFTAAIILGGMGCAITKSAPSKNFYFLASIPLLFALQQLSEGVIWYNFAYHQLPAIFLQFAIRFYLILAFLVWPIWIPLSLFATEEVTWRRFLIGTDLLAGCCLSFVNLSFALKQEATVQIVNHSIQYMGSIPNQLIIYPLIVLIPCFLSSLKNIHLFGWLIAGGYLLANYFYQTTFVSVWCFFAAIISVVIYKILRDNQTNEIKKPTENLES
jgi:hypothetical protein